MRSNVALLVMVLGALASSAEAQPPKTLTSRDGPCGDPLMVSDVYFMPSEYVGARVIAVIDSAGLMVRLKNGRKLHVRITGIERWRPDSAEAAAAVALLQKETVDRQVSILLHGYGWEEYESLSEIEALVHIDFGNDVAELLLRAGLARSLPSEHLRHFEECEYKVAETEAAQNHRGVWIK